MMQPLSAADAIGPAWRHTRLLLLAPRRWQTLLKICAVAFFANIGGFNGSFNQGSHAGRGMPPHITAMLMSMALIFGMIAVMLALAFFYLSSRLQFVLFETVLRRDTTVAPIWNRYGAATWRWMALKLMCGVAVLLCLAPVLVPLVIRVIHTMPKGQAAPAEMVHFFTTIASFLAIGLLVGLVIGAAAVLIKDFGLPSMALESTDYGETLARVGRLVRAEPGQAALYVFLRLLMGIAGVIAAEMALVMAAVIALIPFGGVGLLLWKVLHGGGLATGILFGLFAAVLGLGFIALFVCAAIVAIGYVHVFLQAYALYFLGGRYPLLGQYLEPVLPQTVYPAAPWGPPAYYPPPAPPSV